MKHIAAVLSALVAAAMFGCGGDQLQHSEMNSSLLPTAPDLTVNAQTAVLVGAGDIAVCGFGNAERTAKLLDAIDGTVFTAGDNAYPDGTSEQFRNCYGPTWGRHLERTRPSPGNHDYNTPGAVGYFEYFGSAAGPSNRGYYSYDLGSWQILSLNSNIPAGPGSSQLNWVASEIARVKATCKLAYWHYPVFNSGFDGDMPQMAAIWRLLAENGFDVVIAGHAHDYERFAPLNADGVPDSQKGVREFVVGTGGAVETQLFSLKPTSERFATGVIGVLKLTLRPTSYEWQFVSVPGQSFTDFGSTTCSTQFLE